MERRRFFTAAGISAVALSCNQPNNTESENKQASEKKEVPPILQPFINHSGDGRSFWGPGGDKYEFLVVGKQSGGTTFILNAEVPPGGGPPPHIHNNESESYYVEEGELVFTIGEQTFEAKAKDFIHIPKGTVHTFTNKGKTNAKMLSIFAPAGMEGWFEEVLVPVKDKNEKAVVYTKKQMDFMIEAGPRHGVTWKLPPETDKKS